MLLLRNNTDDVQYNDGCAAIDQSRPSGTKQMKNASISISTRQVIVRSVTWNSNVHISLCQHWIRQRPTLWFGQAERFLKENTSISNFGMKNNSEDLYETRESFAGMLSTVLSVPPRVV